MIALMRRNGFLALMLAFVLPFAISFATACVGLGETREAQARDVKAGAEVVRDAGNTIGGPVGGIVATGAGLVALLAGAWADRLRRQREALIQGVQAGDDRGTKEAIQEAARLLGVSGAIEDSVARLVPARQREGASGRLAPAPKPPEGT